MDPLIIARELTVRRSGVARIERVSFSIHPSDRFSIIGPSGSGKTTLLRHLSGLDDSHGGTLVHRRGVEVGFLFQDGNEVPWLSIRDNFRFYAGRAVEDAEIRLVMEGLGFPPEKADGMLGRYPHAISGGERRRISFALVVAREPNVIFLDEPMTNLDIVARGRVRGAIDVFLRKHPKTAIVLVTHDLEDAILLSDLICVMHQGQIVRHIKVDPDWRRGDTVGSRVIALEKEIVALVGD